MATQTVETGSIRISEGERVRRWRIEQLRRAGCPARAAQSLGARRDVDLHLALDWLPAAAATRCRCESSSSPVGI